MRDHISGPPSQRAARSGSPTSASGVGEPLGGEDGQRVGTRPIAPQRASTNESTALTLPPPTARRPRPPPQGRERSPSGRTTLRHQHHRDATQRPTGPALTTTPVATPSNARDRRPPPA